MDRKQLLRKLGRPALAPLWMLLLAVAVIVPLLSGPGLWEPQEMKVADDALDRAGVDETPAGTGAAEAKARERRERQAQGGCPKEATTDDGPRTLTPRLAAWGAGTIGTSEGDMRLPVALLGVLCVLAVFGIAARLAGPRAGALAGVILLSMPLLMLQARQLTSEIGVATGAALIVYGLIAAARPARWPWALPDLLLSALAAVGGAVIAYDAGGALLGLVPPLAAVALAGGLGLAALVAAGRLLAQAPWHVLGGRHAIGRRRPWRAAAGIHGDQAALAAVSLLAFAAAAVALGVLFHQVYDLREPTPNTRELFGKSVVVRDCWSEALGGLWRFDDDVKSNYHSMFEHAAFGMFPWGVLAPVALVGLCLGVAGDDPRRRLAGRITLAWAAIAWLAATVFERKVGAATFAGFPACAVAIGVWLDGVIAQRRALDDDPTARRGDAAREQRARYLLVGLWALLGMLAVAKDLQAFPEKLLSLLVGGEAIKYPKDVTLLGVPLKAWLLVLGVGTGLALALWLWLWRSRHEVPPARPNVTGPGAWKHVGAWYAHRYLGRPSLAAAIVLAVLTALFWAHGWQRVLSKSLSSKHVFSVYRDLAASGDTLGIMGDMGNAPRYYAGGAFEKVAGREQLIDFLGRDGRVFAMAPANELCAIHRAFAGRPYYVLDDSNARFLLLSNKVDGAVDHNPLSKAILRTKPEGIKTEFSATYDDRIELIGYTVPRAVAGRSKFQMTLYFKVLKAVPGSWKIFVHFDGRGMRFQGDHAPIRERCATSYWQEGDYIVDTFEVEAGDITFEPGNYQIRVGFFTGTNPNWKNMKVTKAPPGAKDDADRVLLGTIQVD